MSVSADTTGEQQFLPEAHTLTDCPLLADAGYVDRAWFGQVNEAGGTVTERGPAATLSGRSTGYGGEVRLGRVSVDPAKFAEDKRFCLWMTNLPRLVWSV